MNFDFKNINNLKKFANKRYLILSLVIILTLLKACNKSHKNDNSISDTSKPASILVNVIKPEKKDVSIELSGRIESKNSIKLIPQTNGIVKEIKIQQGSKVKSGDIILILDEKDKVAELKKAEQLEKQKKMELDINQKLLKNGDVSILSNNKVKTEYNDALSKLRRAEDDLEFTKIRATISGLLDKLKVKKGDYVTDKNDIGDIFNNDSFIAVVFIPQAKIQDIKVGQSALVEVSGKKINGSVSFISNTASGETKTYYAEINLISDDRNDFLSRMINAPVGVKVNYDNVLALKLKDSLIYIDDLGRFTLKILDNEDKVQSIPVSLLSNESNGESWFGNKNFTSDSEVKVISRGAGFFNDGDSVKNIEYENKSTNDDNANNDAKNSDISNNDNKK